MSRRCHRDRAWPIRVKKARIQFHIVHEKGISSFHDRCVSKPTPPVLGKSLLETLYRTLVWKDRKTPLWKESPQGLRSSHCQYLHTRTTADRLSSHGQSDTVVLATELIHPWPENMSIHFVSRTSN